MAASLTNNLLNLFRENLDRKWNCFIVGNAIRNNAVLLTFKEKCAECQNDDKQSRFSSVVLLVSAHLQLLTIRWND